MTFEITRVFAAPIDKVWDAWTTADALEQWYSPGPENWVVDELDVRTGGRFRMHMNTPRGEHVAEGTFHEVMAPRHLRQGPEDGSLVIDTRLMALDKGTHMLLTMEGLPEDQHEMMQGAWKAGFDKLDQLLAN